MRLKGIVLVLVLIAGLGCLPDLVVPIYVTGGITPEGEVKFDTALTLSNTVTDTLKDEMITWLYTGGSSLDKVQKIGIYHKQGSPAFVGTEWFNVSYSSGGYDTCNYAIWTYTYTCTEGVNWDSLTLFYLAHDEDEGVYCIQDTTFVLVGSQQLVILWKLQWN